MGLFDSIIHNFVGGASSEIGRAIGKTAGGVVEQLSENYQTEQDLRNERRRKEANLPANCPHCGAPSNSVLVCEYCNCKIVE